MFVVFLSPAPGGRPFGRKTGRRLGPRRRRAGPRPIIRRAR